MQLAASLHCRGRLVMVNLGKGQEERVALWPFWGTEPSPFYLGLGLCAGGALLFFPPCRSISSCFGQLRRSPSGLPEVAAHLGQTPQSPSSLSCWGGANYPASLLQRPLAASAWILLQLGRQLALPPCSGP